MRNGHSARYNMHSRRRVQTPPPPPPPGGCATSLFNSAVLAPLGAGAGYMLAGPTGAAAGAAIGTVLGTALALRR